jgi:ubiquinone/menaquinone biosynthesis C-methylase UbiE
MGWCDRSPRAIVERVARTVELTPPAASARSRRSVISRSDLAERDLPAHGPTWPPVRHATPGGARAHRSAVPAPVRHPQLGQPVRPGASAIPKRLTALARLVPLRGRRLLDVGCGNGAYTLALAPGFMEVVGVDVEAGRVEDFRRAIAATGAANILALCRSAEQLPFPEAHFDLVTAIEVIEHLADVDAVLAEIRRVLAPGGVFALTVPNRWFPLETHTVVLPVTGREVAGRWIPFLPWAPALHRRLSTARNYSVADLRRCLGAAGFDELGMGFVMPPFDGWAFGRRWIRPITERLERTPLARLGVSIVAAYRRSGSDRPRPERASGT